MRSSPLGCLETTLVTIFVQIVRIASDAWHTTSSPSRLPRTNLDLRLESVLSLESSPIMAPKKIRCNVKDCKEAAQRIIGDCSFCKGFYCGNHRLLEDHKCSGLEDVCRP